MIKKTITYTDFNGEERTEDFWFNLTKAEALELNLRQDLQYISSHRSGDLLMEAWHRIIKNSYGVRSQDGSKFVKRLEDYQDFIGSNAYSELFMEIFSDAGHASEFINGILPADVSVGEPQNRAQRRAMPQDHQQKAPQTVRETYQEPAPQVPTTPAPAENVPAETEQQMRDRIRAELLAEQRAQSVQSVPADQVPLQAAPAFDPQYSQTPPSQVSSEAPQNGQSAPQRDDLI